MRSNDASVSLYATVHVDPDSGAETCLKMDGRNGTRDRSIWRQNDGFEASYQLGDSPKFILHGILFGCPATNRFSNVHDTDLVHKEGSTDLVNKEGSTAGRSLFDFCYEFRMDDDDAIWIATYRRIDSEDDVQDDDGVEFTLYRRARHAIEFVERRPSDQELADRSFMTQITVWSSDDAKAYVPSVIDMAAILPRVDRPRIRRRRVIVLDDDDDDDEM